MVIKKKPAATKPRATKRASARRTGRVASKAAKAVTVLHNIPQWSTALPDWERRIVAGDPLTPCAPLFPDQAEEAWEVYSALQMVDQGSAGNYPTFGELSRKWTKDFVDAIFGCYCGIEGHPLEGRRLIKDFFMLISKKNGKSTLAAGIMLTALILNWRDEAEFLILSPTKEIADNSFKPIAAAIEADPELSAMLHIQKPTRTITHRDTKAVLKVVAADTQTVTGKKAVAVLVDELHEFGKVARAGEMLTEVTGGLMSRPEGFVIYLTTQSSEPPAGVFADKLAYARKVRDGVIEDKAFYPVIYEFPKGYLPDPERPKIKALCEDPANYYITNPNMGASVDEATLVRLLQQASLVSAKELQDKRAKHLNIQVGLHLADENWPGARYWMQQAVRPQITVDYLIDRCEVIVAGLDGGGLDDLIGVSLLGREKDSGKWLAWEHAYVIRSMLDIRQDIAPRLENFEADGDLTIVDAAGDDTRALALILKKVYDAGLLYKIAMDPNAVGTMLEHILAQEIPQDLCETVGQGRQLHGHIRTTERKVSEKVLEHRGSRLMAWCVGNAKVKVVGNAIVITKQVSGTGKIDPLMALFCAVAIMETEPPAMQTELDFSIMGLGR